MADTPDINTVVAAKLPVLTAAVSAYNAQRILDTFDKLAAEYAPDSVQTTAVAITDEVPSAWKKPLEIALGSLVVLGILAITGWALKAFGIV